MEKEFKNATTALGSAVTESKEVVYEFGPVNTAASKRFEYSEKIIKEDGASQDYLEANFLDFPVVASLAKLTKVQSDIRFIENSVLTAINDGLGGGGLNTFQTLLVNNRSFYTSEFVNAKIVMGKKDAAFKPDSVAIYYKREGNNSPPTRLNEGEFAIESGEVVLNKRITREGTYDLTGFLYKKNDDTQEIESIIVNSKLVIAKEPNSAVVSADNMRVFYIGLRNPISISMGAGVAQNTIVPSSPNAIFNASSGGGWTVQSNNASATEIQVNVSAELNGQRRNFNGGSFRLLPPPPGKGSVSAYGESYVNTSIIDRDLLLDGAVTGTKPESFFYDYTIIITAFDIKVGNLPQITVSGNSVSDSSDASSDVRSATRGTRIVISNIKASTRDGNVISPNYVIEKFQLNIE